MPFVAHVAVKLVEDYVKYVKDQWEHIKTVQGVELRMRIRSDLTYEVIAGLFEDKNIALIGAKYMYVTMLYDLLWKGIRIADGGCQFYAKRFFDSDVDNDPENYEENTFFWNKQYRGGGLGVDVYEVDASIDEIDEYKRFEVQMGPIQILNSANLGFENYDRRYFLYTKKAQELLNTVLVADNVLDQGLRATLYCGILEHLSEDELKSPDELQMIDRLSEIVKCSDLHDDKKESLIGLLNYGRNISARTKCKLLCDKYAKETYGKYSTNKILNEAYSVRSTFSHGENCDDRYSNPANLMKYVVLDVIKGYMREQEEKAIQT